MADKLTTRAGQLAIGLAVVGSVAALVNEILSYRRSGVIDWGHIALAIGVPVLMYAIVKTGAKQKP